MQGTSIEIKDREGLRKAVGYTTEELDDGVEDILSEKFEEYNWYEDQTFENAINILIDTFIEVNKNLNSGLAVDYEKIHDDREFTLTLDNTFPKAVSEKDGIISINKFIMTQFIVKSSKRISMGCAEDNLNY